MKLNADQLRSIINEAVDRALAVERAAAGDESETCPECGYNHELEPKAAQYAHEYGDTYVKKSPKPDKKLGEAAGSVGVSSGAAAALANALVDVINDDEGTLANNAYEMWVGTEDPDDMLLPVRHEDVDAFSQKLADQVLADPDLKAAVADVLAGMLTSAILGGYGEGSP